VFSDPYTLKLTAAALDDTFMYRAFGSMIRPSVRAIVSFAAMLAWYTTYFPATYVAVAVLMPMVYVQADAEALQMTMDEITVSVLAVPLAAYNWTAVPIVPLPAAAASCLRVDAISGSH
jgi:hypothetical protein